MRLQPVARIILPINQYSLIEQSLVLLYTRYYWQVKLAISQKITIGVI